TSATCPAASVTIAHVRDAIALARRPVLSDNRHRTRSREGSRVVPRYPRIARSWVGRTIFACVPCMVVPQSLSLQTHTRTALLHKNSMNLQSDHAKLSLSPASPLHWCT